MSRPVPLNDLDRAIKAVGRRPSAMAELYRQLIRGELCALVPYHPEVEDTEMSVQNGSPFPFALLSDGKGQFAPIFSSDARAEEGLRRGGVPSRTYSIASIGARELLEILGAMDLRACLNKSCPTGELMLPPDLLRDLASGAALAASPLSDGGGEKVTLTILEPAERPTDVVQAAFEVMRAHEQFRAGWIFASGRDEARAPLPPWRLLVWMHPRDETVFHDLNIAVSATQQPTANEVEISLVRKEDEPQIPTLMEKGNPFFVRAE